MFLFKFFMKKHTPFVAVNPIDQLNNKYENKNHTEAGPSNTFDKSSGVSEELVLDKLSTTALAFGCFLATHRLSVALLGL